MKKIFLFLILTGLAFTQVSAQARTVELTFTFTRQTGAASNQFAVWVEDAAGNYVKTLFSTQWTAKGGWKRRETSIPIWVSKSNLVNLNDAQIDAVSGATPRTGNLSYKWDGTDSRGAVLPDGDYAIVLEATLRWENQVVYRAPVRLGGQSASAPFAVLYSGDSETERAMIKDVRVTYNAQ